MRPGSRVIGLLAPLALAIVWTLPGCTSPTSRERPAAAGATRRATPGGLAP